MAENRSLWGVCGLRITPLVQCLPPAAGAAAALTYEQIGVMSITLSADIKEGIDDSHENACGGICAVVKTCDTVRSYSIAGEMCSICPDLLAGAIGLQAILDALGNVIGHSVGNALTGCHESLIEIWSKAANNNGQLCTPVGDEFVKFILPRATLGPMENFTLNSGFNNVPLKGDGISNPLLTPAIMEAAFPGSTNGATAWDLNSSLHVIVGTDQPPVNPTCAARNY